LDANRFLYSTWSGCRESSVALARKLRGFRRLAFGEHAELSLLPLYSRFSGGPMRAGRLVLVVATLVTILVFPFLLRDVFQELRLPNAYAAVPDKQDGGRVYQNGNNDSDDNDNNGNSNNNNGNDNSDDNDNDSGDNSNDNTCYQDLNSNEAVPCEDNGNANDNYYDDNTNGNANDNTYAPPPPPPPPPGAAPAASAPTSMCFTAGQTGDVTLNLTGGSVTVRIVSAAPLQSNTSIGLSAIDPATVPAPTGGATLLDTMVWQMSANSPCDGPAVGTLPGAANLGIPYSVSANKAKLQVVFLRNGAWEEVPTTPDPDPNNPFISATIRDAGTYAVIQKP
jgi:hypothetical protein